MPVDAYAEILITALRNTPAFAHGLVRDMRVRWALEEIERPYRTQLYEAMQPRPAEYREWQPFGQVPAFDDGKVRLFETGAILLYLGEQDERLLPRDGQARWQVTAWLIAALNSVEPVMMTLVGLDIFQAGKPWAREARPSTVEMICSRLRSVTAALGDNDWIAGDFSIADIMLVTVLRTIRHTDIMADFPKLAEYQKRGEARPAFGRALADQLRELGPAIKMGETA